MATLWRAGCGRWWKSGLAVAAGWRGRRVLLRLRWLLRGGAAIRATRAHVEAAARLGGRLCARWGLISLASGDWRVLERRKARFGRALRLRRGHLWLRVERRSMRRT